MHAREQRSLRAAFYTRNVLERWGTLTKYPGSSGGGRACLSLAWYTQSKVENYLLHVLPNNHRRDVSKVGFLANDTELAKPVE